MSRRSDIAIAREIYMRTFDRDKLEACMEATYDLGKAAGLDECSMGWPSQDRWRNAAKRLRAKVRKMVEGK